MQHLNFHWLKFQIHANLNVAAANFSLDPFNFPSMRSSTRYLSQVWQRNGRLVCSQEEGNRYCWPFIHQRGKKSSKRPVIHLQGGWPLLFTTVNDIRKTEERENRRGTGRKQHKHLNIRQTFRLFYLDAGKKQTANVNTHENGRFITCVRKS